MFLQSAFIANYYGNYLIFAMDNGCRNVRKSKKSVTALVKFLWNYFESIFMPHTIVACDSTARNACLKNILTGKYSSLSLFF